MTNRYYITGHSGFIGTALMRRWGDQAIPWEPGLPPGDFLIHLAGKVGVQANEQRTLTDTWDEMAYHRQVFDFCAATRTPLFLASSSEIYGSSRLPLKETEPASLPLSPGPRWMYPRIKAFLEQSAAMLANEAQIPVIIGRFFNVTGPGQSPQSGMVLPQMVGAALNGQPLRVFGDGSQVRTFLHINDACTAIEALVRKQLNGLHVVNIGSRNTLTVLELAKRIVELLDARSPVVFEKPRLGEVRTRIPDIGLLESLVGWYRPVGIESIITDTAVYLSSAGIGRRPG